MNTCNAYLFHFRVIYYELFAQVEFYSYMLKKPQRFEERLHSYLDGRFGVYL